MDRVILILFSLIWPVLTALLGFMEIYIALLLKREKGPGPKMMLGGSVAGVIGNLAGFTRYVFAGAGEISYLVTWSLTALGAMIFTIGLLLHALRQRNLTRRIDELEAILATRTQG